jgi:hypothetical protein
LRKVGLHSLSSHIYLYSLFKAVASSCQCSGSNWLRVRIRTHILFPRLLNTIQATLQNPNARTTQWKGLHWHETQILWRKSRIWKIKFVRIRGPESSSPRIIVYIFSSHVERPAILQAIGFISIPTVNTCQSPGYRQHYFASGATQYDRLHVD